MGFVVSSFKQVLKFHVKTKLVKQSLAAKIKKFFEVKIHTQHLFSVQNSVISITKLNSKSAPCSFKITTFH